MQPEILQIIKDCKDKDFQEVRNRIHAYLIAKQLTEMKELSKKLN